MTRLCRHCGAPFTPAKPFHVTCFDCYVKQIREQVSERAKVLEKSARIVKLSGKPAPKSGA